ncbi:hypothetical protein [Calidifontibacter terrae]
MSTAKPRVRRTPAPWWFGALVAVPLVFGVVGAQASHGGIEQNLNKRTTNALQAVGITDATVTFSGRDAHVALNAQGSQSAVHSALDGLSGLRQVTVTGGQP